MKRAGLLCFCLVLGLAVLAKSQDTDTLTLGKGESKTYTVGDPSGCFVDNTSILSLQTIGDNQIKVTALQPGQCTLTLPGKGGRNRYIEVAVSETVPSSKLNVPSSDLKLGTRNSELAPNPDLKLGTSNSNRNRGSNRSNNGVRARVKVAGVSLSTNLGLANSAPTPEPTPDRTMIQYNVKLVQVSESNARQLGIDWANTLQGPNAGGDTPLHVSEQANPPLLNWGSFQRGSTDVKLDALVTQGFAKVLAEPMVLVENNSTSDNGNGGQLPLVSAAPLSSNSINLKQYGTTLTIGSQLVGDGKVETKYNIEQSLPDSTYSVSQSNGASAPALRNGYARGQVCSKLGDTVFLDSLVQVQQMKTTSKVPVLGDLWLIGGIFTNTSTQDTRDYILIFMTPDLYATRAKAGQDKYFPEQEGE